MNTPYVPSDPGPNPNISDAPPWRLVALLASGFVALLVVAWLVLGWIGGALATRIPDDIESRLGDLMSVESMQGQDPVSLAARDHLQDIVDAMATHLPERDLRYRVVVVDDPAVNAAAVPGGGILVFRGLLDAARSENEVAMVLGHEIAHHHHRDHLERMGRQVVVGTVLNAIFGGTTGLEELSRIGTEGFERKMGRDDERAADALALDLLYATYGHVGGATDFFERMAAGEGSSALAWLRTHPMSSERIERIRRTAEERGYRFGRTEPLPDFDEGG